MNTVTMEPIRIGMLFFQTGSPRDRAGERMGTCWRSRRSTGRRYRRPAAVQSYDQSSPTAISSSPRLILEDNVRVILGCYMSSTRKAVIPVVEKWHALLMYPTLYEGFEYSRNVVYTGAAPNQNSVQLAEFMLRTYGSRVFMVGSDHIYPCESNRIMSDLILERGGESGRALPAVERRMEAYLEIAQDQALVARLHLLDRRGRRHCPAAPRLSRSGARPSRMPIGSLTTCEAEVQQMGAELAEGHITSACISSRWPPTERTLCAQKQRLAGRGHQHVLGGRLLPDHWCRALRKARSDNVREPLRVLPAPSSRPRRDWSVSTRTIITPTCARASAE
jgi:branched-chain amino acid transport system substrate-binding protein